MHQQSCYLLGTPFSGSTLLSNILNAHPLVFNAGEVDRLSWLRRHDHVAVDSPSIYLDGCTLCGSAGLPCPVWTTELMATLQQQQPRDFHASIEARVDSPVIVDASKAPAWFRDSDGMGRTDRRVCGILVSRSPYGFAASFKRRTGLPAWRCAEIWRDITIDALRTLNGGSGTPWMLVRYETLLDRPEETLQRLCGLLGVVYYDVFQAWGAVPSHALGGNPNAFLAYRGNNLSMNTLAERAPAHRPPEYARSDAASISGGFRDESWAHTLDPSEVRHVCTVPGVADIAGHLGYDLVGMAEYAAAVRAAAAPAPALVQDAPAPAPAPVQDAPDTP